MLQAFNLRPCSSSNAIQHVSSDAHCNILPGYFKLMMFGSTLAIDNNNQIDSLSLTCHRSSPLHSSCLPGSRGAAEWTPYNSLQLSFHPHTQAA